MALCPICAGTGRTTGLEHPAGESKPCPEGCPEPVPRVFTPGVGLNEIAAFIRSGGVAGRTSPEIRRHFGIDGSELHNRLSKIQGVTRATSPDFVVRYVLRDSP